MKIDTKIHLPFILISLIFTAYYFTGVHLVPFHPDESTYLFMSSDFSEWIAHPRSLVWDRENTANIRQHYREIDAPLTRYLLGFGLMLTGEKPLAADWDWEESWETNRLSGALPTPQQLLVGRSVMAAFFPLSLLFLYLIGIQIQGRATGLLAVLIFSTNSLVLLHTRRAMAEGPLVFTSILFLWAITKTDLPALILGAAAALAFNSKHSLGAAAPVGFVASLWRPAADTSRNRWISALQFLLAFIFLTLALNPILWRQPLAVARKSLAARGDLMKAQIEDFGDQNPDLVLDSLGDRLMAAAAQLYLLPPSFQEAGNYLSQTQTSIDSYLKSPAHTLFRGLADGGVLIGLSIFGFTLGILEIVKRGWSGSQSLVLLLAATCFQTIAILLVIPLPFQRYYMPLVPYSVLWVSYGVALLWLAAKKGVTGVNRRGSTPNSLIHS